jgi:ABC-type phosphate transport system substrate-binding protein
MRTRIELFSVALVSVLVLAVAPVANAAVNVWIGVGASSQWQDYALAAVNDPTLGANHHYTVKGKASDGNYYAQALDSRSGPGGTVDNAPNGNIWIAWYEEADKTVTKVWAYLSTDSVVGTRLFFATPRPVLQLDTGVETAGSSLNLISPYLFAHGVSTTEASCPAGATTCDDDALPTAVYSALNNVAISAALTDIRPEDALFASHRANCTPATASLSCLGYGVSGSPTGTGIESAFSTSANTPVDFAITGTDPVSGDAVPAFSVYPVGAQPVIVITNRTDAAGLGQTTITNATQAELRSIFNGTTCNTSELGGKAHDIYPILRDPLSGTANVWEYTIQTSPTTLTGSQETGIDPSTDNPVNNLPCKNGGGRYRAGSTSEVVSGGKGGPASPGGVQNIADSLGYIFFSYGNVSTLAGSTSYGYLTLDGVDPLVGQPNYVKGELPVCSTSSPIKPCPASPNTTFTNLRNGDYRSWSFLRAVTDASGVNNTNTAYLVHAAQLDINTYVPDFVPYIASSGDDGMKFYRSHFVVPDTGVTTANNGIPFKDPSTEKGGDVGGCIYPTSSAGELGKHENTPACTQ